MVERSAEGPKIVLIDTNVIVKGAIDFTNNIEGPEAKMWFAFLQGGLKAAFSDRLLSEVVTVARRLMGKDFASKLRSQILQKSEIVPNAKLLPHVSQFVKEVPTEDIVHAALASVTGAKYVVSNNRKFLCSLETKSGFKCMTPESFVKTFRL